MKEPNIRLSATRAHDWFHQQQEEEEEEVE